MRNEKGFALIQVIVAAAIGSVLSLAMTNLILEQRISIAYLEDKLEKIQLIRNFETILKDKMSCQKTLEGVRVGSSSTQKINVNGLKDNSGNVVYESNSIIGRLAVGQISITNESVPGPSSSGFINIIMPVSRTRQGEGPSVFKPLEFKLNVTISASRVITSCSSKGEALTDMCMCGFDAPTYSCSCCDGVGWVRVGSFDQDAGKGQGRSSINGPFVGGSTHYMMNICVRK